MSRGTVKRKTGFLKQKYQYAIFSEGEVTEPSYFRGLKQAIERNAAYQDMIYIRGTAESTMGVLDAANVWVSENRVRNCRVWCLYDKDDFSDNDFNAVLQRMKALNESDKNGNEYFAGWSNESFEYWLVLHFKFYQVNNGRQDYERILDEKFKEKLGKSYSKKQKDCDGSGKDGNSLWSDMITIGNLSGAIRYAEKQLQHLRDQLGDDVIEWMPSRAVPATKVHELVKDLLEYLPVEEKRKYLAGGV